MVEEEVATYMIRVYDDGGAEATHDSLNFFRLNVGLLGEVKTIHIDDRRKYAMEIISRTKNVVFLLSGVGCGYRGTAPTGSITVLRTLGIRDKEIEAVIELKPHVTIQFDLDGVPHLEATH